MVCVFVLAFGLAWQLEPKHVNEESWYYNDASFHGAY